MRLNVLQPVRYLVAMVLGVMLVAPSVVVAAQPSSIAVGEWMPGAFDRPTHLTHDNDARLFVVEQSGIVRVVPDASDPAAGAALFLDLTDRVGASASEQGLLSIAFSPDAHDGNHVYASYTDLDGNSVVSRFDVAEDGLSADPASERQVLAHVQPYANHNGGLIVFGPDDMLYAGFGDGGSQGDPDGNGQNLSTWLGAILRVDVDPAGLGDEGGYVVPGDNPFVDDPDAAPEIWMYGLRNPWRFAFDPEGTMIAVADVGGSQLEEVTILPFQEAAGANLGWPLFEGSACHDSETCDTAGLTMPSVEYTHAEGGCSITGGAFIDGAFVYGDYCSGLIWLATPGGDGGWTVGQPVETGLSISSFGVGGDGAVYVCDLASGSIYRLAIG